MEQGQPAPVPNALGDLAPHLVMVDPVAKLLQVHIHDPGVTLFEVRLRPLYRLMRVAGRSEAEARIREGGIPLPLEHLPHRLVDEAVHDGGNPKCSDPSLRFRAFDSLHWLRLVGPFQQGLLHPRPVLLEIGRERLDRHPVNPWASAIALALFECPKQGVTLHNPFHETFICGRTLGGGLLLGRFALDGPGQPQLDCRLPVQGMSTPMVPSYRSGLQRWQNTSLSPVRPSVSVPCSFALPGGFLVRPCGLRLVSVSLLLLCRLLPSPLGSGPMTLPSAISDGPWETSRGKTPSFPRVGAGFIKHAPIAHGGLRGHVPPRPERATPPTQFLFVAPRVWIGLPSDPASRRRPCPSPRLRLREHLARGLAPR